MFENWNIFRNCLFTQRLFWSVYFCSSVVFFCCTGLVFFRQRQRQRSPLSEWTFWLRHSSVALAESAWYSWELCQKGHPFYSVGIRERCWRPVHCLQRHLHSEKISAFQKVQSAAGLKLCSTFLAALSFTVKTMGHTANSRVRLENSVFLSNQQPRPD